MWWSGLNAWETFYTIDTIKSASPKVARTFTSLDQLGEGNG